MQPKAAPVIEPQGSPLPSRLGVIAAAGAIPIAVCEAAEARGIEVFVAALRGQAGPDIERFPHRWIRIGELGGMIGALRKAGCQQIVIVGALRRPNIWRAGMDFGFIRHLPTILSLTRGGDDTILKRVVRFFEAQGFTVRGAHEFAPSLLAPPGPCGKHMASEAHHRWRDDIAIMGELGLHAYRFSIAWPRIQPDGTGAVNQAGLDFYDRLVDGLLEAGIDPVFTLYHWDLPQTLEDAGGWRVRDTAEAFAAYAGIVAARLGDRVRTIATLNEPWCSATLGYFDGVHAPGHTSRGESLAAAHHLLLAHGLGTQAIRAEAPGADVGIVLNFEPKHPASDDPLDLAAAEVSHALMNRWFLDPVAGRGYPEPGVAATGWAQEEVAPGDLAVIAQPLDFLGVNYYYREIVRSPQLPADRPGLLRRGDRRTDMDWEVYPAGLTEILDWIWGDYGIGPLYVTENGAAFHDDTPVPPFRDERRRAYLADHLAAAREAIGHGVPLAGYFVWSLLDNFEWAWGYDQRFGIVHVDYDTQQRTIRESGRWYADVIAANALPGR